MVLEHTESSDGSAAVQVREPDSPLTVTAPVPYASSGSLRNPFPPIADYAFLSDCENTCLISSAGSVEWMCVPRPDSPSVFGAILDRGAGHFRLGPYGVSVPAARRYLPGSLILETTWQTHTGWVIVRDALVMGPWHDIETAVPHPPPHPDGLGRRAHPAAHRAMRERHGRVGDELRAGVRLPPHPRNLGVLGPGLRRGDRPGQQVIPTRIRRCG